MKSRIPAFIVGAALPITAVLALMPWYNRIEPMVLGFPFGYFWIFLWIVLTSACLWVAYRIDPANREKPSGKEGGKAWL
jgi:tellurite resistance protein TehA-like permease